MMVNVNVTLDVSPDNYRREYGTDESAAEIRENLKQQTVDAIDISLKHLQPHVVRSVEVR